MRCLILNVSMEPLHVCDARRALLLVLDENADVVLESDTVVHSQYVNFNLPSVIRLRRYVNVPRMRSIPLTTRTVVARDGGVCAYCDAHDPTMTMDHIIPRAQGGAHTWENVIAACRRCNHKKDNRTPEQAKMPLHFAPTRPRGAHARLLLYGVEPAWAPYMLQAIGV